MKKLVKVIASVMMMAIATTTVPMFNQEVKAEVEGDFAYEVINGEAIIYSYDGNDSEVIIPETLGGYEVTTLKERAFNFNNNVTSVIMPDTITKMEPFVFASCQGLESIKLSEGLTEIPPFTFTGNLELKSIEIPKNVTLINEGAFYGCRSMTSAKLPDGLETIYDGAFNSCFELKSIEIPSSVRNIGIGSFGGCYSLVEVVIPEGVVNINPSAFIACTGLEKIDIAESVSYIGTNAIPVETIIYGHNGTEAQKYALDNDMKFVSKDISISEGLNVSGFQMNTEIGGLRTLYSVETKIDEMEVVERGLVYGLADGGITEEDMYVGADSEFVRSYAATSAGKYNTQPDISSTADTYVMTMTQQIEALTVQGLQAVYYVRVYAKLSDGSYVYSDVYNYSIFSVAKKLYDGKIMNRLDKHQYLYNNILSVVDKDYEKVVYDEWSSSVMPEQK